MRLAMKGVTVLFALASAGPATAQDCDHEAVRTATLRVPAGGRLDLEAGAGSLRVEGRVGLGEVRVRGRACASTEALLGELTIESRVAGDVVHVETRQPELDGSWRKSYAYIDLVVEVPAEMAATIDDGSGSAVLLNLGDVEVEDGSGDLELTNVRSARVDDGSGNVRIERVAGDVELEDGSGNVTIRDVRGSVTLEDGSGELSVSDVTGSVHVRDDGSGSIRVRGIGGDFVVDADGSGSIEHHDVRGRVRIPD